MKGNLVLDRAIGESIILEVDGKQIEVTVIKSGDNVTKLAIQADNTVRIIRKELVTKPTF